MNRESGTRTGRKKHRASILRLTADQEKEILALYRDGASIRQIAIETGISRSTLGRWIVGPLTVKLGKILKDRKRRAAPEQRNHPAPSAEIVDQGIIEQDDDQVDQGAPVSDQVRPVAKNEAPETIVSYHPEWQFGNVLTSRGEREPGVPGVQIESGPNGALCSRCREPVGIDPHDLLFEVDAAGIHRPVCEDCRKPGDQLHGWPGPNGREVKHAPGLGEKPNPVVRPFDLPPLVKTPPSPWSPRPSSGPGVRKYPPVR